MAETASDLGSAPCFHPLGWRNSGRGGEVGGGGGYAIVCSHKYTKLAAYQLISVHDPLEIFSARPKPLPSLEPCFPAGSMEMGRRRKGREGALIKSLFKDNKAGASSS